MKTITVTSLILLVGLASTFAVQSNRSSVAGAWDGSITVAGQALKIRVVFSDSGGVLGGTIDIPQQGATGLPLRNVKVDDASVHVELPAGPTVAMFDGRIDGNTIAGTFAQGPATGSFSLTRTSATVPAAAPVPYRQEELVVTNADVTLAGTLTIPEGRAPFPAVVLISGSGAQSRDEDIFGFKIFRDIADYLTRRGVAVYRYDDRGVGGSSGNIATSTSADFAGDALAAIKRLQSHSGIDARRIGLLGHSEGALVAAIAGARSTDVAFVVFLAGPGVRGELVLRQQAADLVRAQGATDDVVARIVAAHQQVTAAVIRNAAPQELENTVRALVAAQYDALPEAQRSTLGARDAFVAATVKPAMAQIGSPWMRFFIAFDPAEALGKIKVPVYAAFGSLDMQVPVRLNDQPLRAALAGNPNVTAKVYEGANHLFQKARTGLPGEYATLEPAFISGLLDDVSGWIRKAVGATGPDPGRRP